MYNVIDFYEEVSREENCYERGYFWWACPPYIFDRPIVTRFWHNRPTQELKLEDFDSRNEESDEINITQPGEFLGVSKFKRRPVIVLSTSGSPYRDRAWKGGEYFLVAPTRTLRSKITGEYRANPNFVWDAITYQYSSVFYLPRDPEYDFLEAVIQFDRIVTLHRSWLLEPRKAKLSHDAKVCIDCWLRNYIFGKVPISFNKNLEAYREMVGEDPKIRTGIFGKSSSTYL
jgi:hypothetical protein